MTIVSDVLSKGVGLLIIITCFALPAGLSVMNIICLIKPKFVRVMGIISWSCTVFFGTILSIFYACMVNISPFSQWDEQLYNSNVHQPFWTDALGIYIAILILAIGGFAVLAAVELRKTPPLLFVLAMAAQYPFMAACIVWCVQISTTRENAMLAVFPANLIIIILTMFRIKILAWRKKELEKTYGNEKASDNQNRNIPAENLQTGKKVISGFRKILNDSAKWPVLAFIFALPMLGIILGFAVLFGQSPDILIKAWTETADWRLSGRTAPPNLYYDEHYLCTVAAGGHEKVVKPIRMGERHGHRVVVNRQLEIANAFEQVLEERTPHLHRIIRYIYDRYGFPIARLIRTKTACDVVYVIMKPLEWFFLCIIYLTDARPEDRIVVQYMPGYREFLEKHRCKS